MLRLGQSNSSNMSGPKLFMFLIDRDRLCTLSTQAVRSKSWINPLLSHPVLVCRHSSRMHVVDPADREHFFYRVILKKKFPPVSASNELKPNNTQFILSTVWTSDSVNLSSSVTMSA